MNPIIRSSLISAMAVVFFFPLVSIHGAESAGPHKSENRFIPKRLTPKSKIEQKKESPIVQENMKTEAKSEPASPPQAKDEAKRVTVKQTPKAQRNVRRSFEAWLADLKKRVSRSQAKQNQLVAVASVRGDDAQDPVPLYWKGDSDKKTIEKAELNQFDQAIDLAGEGDVAAAEAQLEAFIQTYPNSPLISEANQTLTYLKDIQTEQP